MHPVPEPLLAERFAEFDAVSVRHGEVRVLDVPALMLPLSQRTVILGANGAGKTTLLQLVQGLAQPTTGQVRRLSGAGLSGAGLSGAGLSGAGRPGTGPTPAVRLAYVFQKPVMLRRSAQANVEHALAMAGVPSHRRAAMAGAALDRLGLAYAAHRPARRLSGGEQQRVALARALALEPHCLLLDEPTASLDPGAAAAIERELLALAADGIGLVMATHDLAMARRLASHLVFVHRGRVLESGPADQCFHSPRHETLRRFLAGQWLD
ncbi:MAG: ATP-binding cassette domain-containing protein [Burkholderiaceae bacterium]|nr:ATP-binding cassette domain-containing protein [Burkholderiaceae bacterium]